MTAGGAAVVQPEVAVQPEAPVAAFTDVMARLAAGVAIVTARRPDGDPCGLLVSSLCSYSVAPPSVLVVIDRASRSYPAMCVAPEFGVHLLVATQTELAKVFAGRSPRKFDRIAWGWDGAVPRLHGAGDYLRCRSRTTVPHGDHAIVIGEVETVDEIGRPEGQPEPSEPLLYYRRRLGWRLAPGG